MGRRIRFGSDRRTSTLRPSYSRPPFADNPVARSSGSATVRPVRSGGQVATLGAIVSRGRDAHIDRYSDFLCQCRMREAAVGQAYGVILCEWRDLRGSGASAYLSRLAGVAEDGGYAPG